MTSTPSSGTNGTKIAFLPPNYLQLQDLGPVPPPPAHLQPHELHTTDVDLDLYPPSPSPSLRFKLGPMASPQSWTKSATAIVRDIFASKRYLKAQDIWKIGTADTRPIMQPTTAIDQWGRIRMKRVSNIREGRRVWVPPPVAPMPHHPFQAMR